MERKNLSLLLRHQGSQMITHEVKIEGPSKVVYSPDKPLPCGARVWIETEEKVVLDNGLCLEK